MTSTTELTAQKALAAAEAAYKSAQDAYGVPTPRHRGRRSTTPKLQRPKPSRQR